MKREFHYISIIKKRDFDHILRMKKFALKSA